MALRDSMTPIVTLFRQYGQVGTTEEFNGVNYWSDDQLQDILDETKKPNTPLITLLNDEHDLWNIELPHWYWVDPDTIDIQDSNGNSLYSAYVYASQTITGFGVIDLKNNTINSTGLTPSNSSYQVFGMWFSMYDALAMLWDRRAAQRYDYIQMKAGQNTLRMQNEYEHCISQRDYYRGKIARAHQRTGRKNRWVTS